MLPIVEAQWPGWGVTMPGGLTIDSQGRFHIVLTMAKPPATDAVSVWGHSSCEVVQLTSRDGKHFDVRLASQADPTVPHWLPNLERPTGFNQVDWLGKIYTGGTRAENNKQIVSNAVHWAW